jgi:hypothetical protein
MALHHIRHRQIQSKILNQVYCAPGRLKTLSDAEKNAILHKLQSDLEDWRDALPDVCARSTPSYPLQQVAPWLHRDIILTDFSGIGNVYIGVQDHRSFDQLPSFHNHP